jgi:hypothetical protein
MLRKVEMRFGNEQLITPGGLATVGLLINKTNIYEEADKIKTTRRTPGINNSDIIGSYIGLLCQGKTDYQAVNELRVEPEYYSGILGTKCIPSEETLRQRLDAMAVPIIPVIKRSNTMLLKNANVKPGMYKERYVPIDIDTVPFDNSNSKKEGVSWTYKKYMGYTPIMAYIGTEGYGLGAELREGSQHSQKGTEAFLTQVLKSAKKVTGQPLLVRMDSGFDSVENLEICTNEETHADFIIKRNIRNESKDGWYALALHDADFNGNANIKHPRDGKTVYIGSTYRHLWPIDLEVRIVYEIITRTSTASGQLLLDPDIEVNTYWASMYEDGENGFSDDEVILAYHDHGTSEQFHSEVKTDMDLERFPSGHFNTNAAILLLGLFAYNILRIMGQTSLRENDSPLKRPVMRRRIKTVIQNLVAIAVRVVRHAGKTFLSLGRSNAWRFTFKRVHEALLE